MLPLLGGLITGGASLLGSIFSSDTSAQNTQAQIAAQEQMQSQTEQFNAQQAQINRDFQQQMSSTAYQRASSDMTSAGLNPMMMFGSGGPASVPGGATASVGTPTVPTSQRTSPLAGLGDAASKVVSTAVQAETFEKMKQEIASLKTEQAKTAAVTDLVRQQAKTETEETGKRGQEAQLAALRVPVAQTAAREHEAINRLPSWLIEGAGITKYGAGVASGVGDAASTLMNSALGVSRLKDAFLRRKIDQGNFVGRYGTPVDEYLAQ